MTTQPLRTVLSSPNQFERLTKRAIELNEYIIEYEARTFAKLIKLPSESSEISASREKWTLNVDGTSSEHISGIDIWLVSLTREVIEQFLLLAFSIYNKDVKYKVLITGHKLGKIAGAKKRVYFYSYLVQTN